MRNDKLGAGSPSCYVTKAPKERDLESETDPNSTKASENTSGKQSASFTSATGWSDESALDPTDTMIKRWLRQIQNTIPTVDLIDISAEANPNKSKKR